jgi:hypothetical protein
VHARQDALKIALCVPLCALSTACGAIFHSSQTVTFATRPEDRAVVYRHGAPLVPPVSSTTEAPPVPSATVFLADARGFVATAPGKKIARIDPPAHVDGVAITLDVLWCVTILGVAAPIVDGLMGTFSKVEEQIPVVFEPDPEETHPLPVYSVAGWTFAATDTPAAPARDPATSPATQPTETTPAISAAPAD